MDAYMSTRKDVHIVTRSLDMKLRVLRAERQLSLREASERTGVDKVSLSRFERGLAHPQDRTLGKIAKGYGVPVEELLEEPVLAGKAEAPSATPGATWTGPPSKEWALGADPDLLRLRMKETASDRLRELGEELAA